MPKSDAERFLRARHAKLKCESCGRRKWAMLDVGDLALLCAGGIGSLVTFGAPVEGVSCVKCRHVRLYLSDRATGGPDPMMDLVETDG